MVTDKTVELRIKIRFDEEAITDSPYWPAIAQGKKAETAEQQLLIAEVKQALENLDYVKEVQVEENFG